MLFRSLVPNTWICYSIVSCVVDRLLHAGYTENEIGESSALLIEQLRNELSKERDLAAEIVFREKIKAGQIEFGLRADRSAYEIPMALDIELPKKPRALVRAEDGKAVERSLFEPFYESMVDNEFESDFACYLDGKAAIDWWHRNVAKTQYGLQGWKRNKVYPDFVFLKTATDGKPTLVVMETKGAHLKNEDTDYKQELFTQLTKAYAGAKLVQAGELELTDASGDRVVCDLVFDENWMNKLNQTQFAE